MRAGGAAPPGAARECPTVGHDSFAGLFPSRDRGSARTARQPGLLPISALRAPTGRAHTVSLSPQLPMRAFGADDGTSNRTPTAWLEFLHLLRRRHRGRAVFPSI